MHYLLAEANQNTFVLFDRLQIESEKPEFYERVNSALKNEERDDALILFPTRSWGSNSILHMQVLGLDGNFGEFCGNGALSCAAYLYDNYPNRDCFFLQTPAGPLPLLRKEAGVFQVRLPCANFQMNTKFMRQYVQGFDYVEILEPHLTIEANLSSAALCSLAQKLNARKDIFPHGINVNAWHVVEDGCIYVKTYERGVQRMTRSCGSGSSCCAAIYGKRKMNMQHVRVQNAGGSLDVFLGNDAMILQGKALYSNKPILGDL